MISSRLEQTGEMIRMAGLRLLLLLVLLVGLCSVGSPNSAGMGPPRHMSNRLANLMEQEWGRCRRGIPCGRSHDQQGSALDDRCAVMRF